MNDKSWPGQHFLKKFIAKKLTPAPASIFSKTSFVSEATAKYG